MPVTQTTPSNVVSTMPVKPWWRRYSNTLVFFFGSSAFAIYLGLVHWVNPVPNPDELIRVPIKVLGVKALDPHLHVQLADGSQRMMEFPVLFGLRPNRYHGLSDDDKKKLRGCEGEIRGIPVRLVLTDRFRVWGLQCGDVHLGFDVAQRDYVRLQRVEKEGLILYWGLIFLFSIFCIWAEGRRK